MLVKQSSIRDGLQAASRQTIKSERDCIPRQLYAFFILLRESPADKSHNNAICKLPSESHCVRDRLHQRRLCKRRYSRLTFSNVRAFFGITFESTRLIIFDPHQQLKILASILAVIAICLRFQIYNYSNKMQGITNISQYDKILSKNFPKILKNTENSLSLFENLYYILIIQNIYVAYIILSKITIILVFITDYSDRRGSFTKSNFVKMF